MSTQKRKRRIYYRPGVRTRITYKRIAAVSSGVFALVAIGAFFYFGGSAEQARAAVNGDYRSVSSRLWSSTSTWQMYNGTSWVAAGAAPTSANNIIEIQSGNVVSINASVNIDQVVIDAGATLNITSGTTSIVNGSGTDMQIDGTLNQYSTLTL